MTDAGAWAGGAEGARLPVDAFLDRVERGLLTAGVVRPVRATVIGRLESEIVERVSRSGKSPTPDDVAAALEEFGGGGVALGKGAAEIGGREWRRYVRAMMPQRSRAGFWGAMCVMLSLVPMVAVLVFLTFFSPAGLRIEADFPRDRVHAQMGMGGEAATVFRAVGPEGTVDATVSGGSAVRQFFSLFAPLSPVALAATLLGLFAVVEILMSKGRVRGLAMALFAMMFYPVLLSGIVWWLSLG